MGTSRGFECGTISFANKMIPEDSIKGNLKPVIRLATKEDIKQHEKNLSEKSEILKTTVEQVREHKLDMKVIGAEYTFDRSKLIIYFTADERVDFRELVKSLAAKFRTRIELRQIYERDSVKCMVLLLLVEWNVVVQDFWKIMKNINKNGKNSRLIIKSNSS